MNMKNPWKILEGLLREAKQYRGSTAMRLKDIDKMLFGDPTRDPPVPGVTGTHAKPDGEGIDAANGGYSFNPDIWTGWRDALGPALAAAATGDDPHAGKAQGHLTTKTNWGGRVRDLPGKARTDFERQPSTMDRYDMVMVAEVGTRVNKKGVTVPTGRLIRVAYSPSIGSYDERRARLEALLAGQTPPPLNRRPQGEVPEPTKQDVDRWDREHPKAQPVLRIGQNKKGNGRED